MNGHRNTSNTRITLREDSLKEPLPTSDNGLGWVQIQQKSLRWEEHMGLTSETLQRIYDSCKIQRQLETANIFTPTRHILQTIKRVCQVEGIHGLPAVAAPTFFPKASKNKDTWWETKAQESSNTNTPQDEQSTDESGETEYTWDSSNQQEEGETKKTAYIWDSMDKEGRTDTIEILNQSDYWVIWKSKDKWSDSLTSAGSHQLLYIKKYIQEECWGSKIKGW